MSRQDDRLLDELDELSPAKRRKPCPAGRRTVHRRSHGSHRGLLVRDPSVRHGDGRVVQLLSTTIARRLEHLDSSSRADALFLLRVLAVSRCLGWRGLILQHLYRRAEQLAGAHSSNSSRSYTVAARLVHLPSFINQVHGSQPVACGMIHEPDTAQKAAIREQARKNRVAQKDKDEISRGICAKFMALPAYAAAKTVMWYVDAGSEVRTRHTLPEALTHGKRVVVPWCVVETNATRTVPARRHERTGRRGVQDSRTEGRTPQPPGEAWCSPRNSTW